MEIEAIVVDEEATFANIWKGVNDELDSAVSLLHSHFSQGECKVPWCTGSDFEEAMLKTKENELRALLHVAIYRLAMIKCTEMAVSSGDSERAYP